MSKVVGRKTNTGTGAHWLRRTMGRAARLAKNTRWFGSQDGYLLWAKRVGKQRTAMLLDLPPQLRVVGSVGAVPGEFFGQPRLNVGGSRDAFSPGFGADPVAATTKNLEAAQFPTAWRTVNISTPPALFAVFMGGALPTANDVTKLWFAGDGVSFSTVQFYPLSSSRNFFTRVEFLKRGDSGFAVTTNEPFVSAITGGYVFSPREINPTIWAQVYPVVLPYVATDYDPVAATIVVSTPMVKPLAKVAGDTGRDYGEAALLFSRSAGVGTVDSATALYLFQFPADAQFEQPLWFGEEATGYTPTIIYSEAILRPDGVTAIYGGFFSLVYGSSPTSELDFEQMQTRFKLEVTADGENSWVVLSCNVTGVDAALGARRVGSIEGEFEWFDKPVVFYGAGDTWAFWVAYELPPDGLQLPIDGGGSGRPSDTSVVVNRGGVEEARGAPANITLSRNLGSDTLLIPRPPGVNYLLAFVACHVDTGGVYGLSFFGWDRTTEELKLCKWDTVDGFGIWNVDLTQMNLKWDVDLAQMVPKRADRIPGISVYQRCSVLDGVVVGLPSFVANSEYEGLAETHIIANGVAKSAGAVSGLGVAAIGNPLQASALNNLYRE